MTVKEYRENHPRCRYCKHFYHLFSFCYAKKKDIYINKAKRCPLYEALEGEKE